MRDYSKVSSQFWTGSTGKQLKAAGPEAVIVAMYLMTCHHANMIGLYYLPRMYIAHETGLGDEGASKGLDRCIEAGFCTYEEASEHVLVHEMAKFQIGEQLDARDKRCTGIENELRKAPKGPLQIAFREKYSDAFHLRPNDRKTSTLQGASKPLRSQEQEQKQEQEQERTAAKRGARLPADWEPTETELRWARDARPDIDASAEAERFADYWHGVAGQRGVKLDWPATWRNWVRRADAPRRGAAGFTPTPYNGPSPAASRRLA